MYNILPFCIQSSKSTHPPVSDTLFLSAKPNTHIDLLRRRSMSRRDRGTRKKKKKKKRKTFSSSLLLPSTISCMHYQFTRSKQLNVRQAAFPSALQSYQEHIYSLSIWLIYIILIPRGRFLPIAFCYFLPFLFQRKLCVWSLALSAAFHRTSSSSSPPPPPGN